MNATIPLTEDATIHHVIDAKESSFVVQVGAQVIDKLGQDPLCVTSGSGLLFL